MMKLYANNQTSRLKEISNCHFGNGYGQFYDLEIVNHYEEFDAKMIPMNKHRNNMALQYGFASNKYVNQSVGHLPELVQYEDITKIMNYYQPSPKISDNDRQRKSKLFVCMLGILTGGIIALEYWWFS